MIRRYFHHRWAARQSPGERLMCTFRELGRWTWIDRFCAWHVRTWGERPPTADPWPVKLTTSFVMWCSDWRSTLALRRPWHSSEFDEVQQRLDKEKV